MKEMFRKVQQMEISNPGHGWRDGGGMRAWTRAVTMGRKALGTAEENRGDAGVWGEGDQGVKDDAKFSR